VKSKGELMFGFYSSRVGCLGSLAISVLVTILVALILRSFG
jgi:hypothetical protein